MQTRTICCKLRTAPQMDNALEETAIRFADSCNFVLKRALEEKTNNAIKLHELCYAESRKQFGLSANLTIRSIRRVSGSLARLKGNRRVPKSFKTGSISYDARIFYCTVEEGAVSLKTTQGRLVIPMELGAYQRKALAGKNPTSATVIRKGEVWYIHMVVECDTRPCAGKDPMGVDLGIVNIAATSTELRIQGKSRQEFKTKCAKVRASLQSKGTAGAKKTLKKISGKERRRIKHENHILSKQLVDEAKRHDCGVIRMEQLKGIRDRTRTWSKHLNRMVAGWSFYQLQQFVSYKAAAVGISVEFVDPRYTSQTCHHCLTLGSRRGERFSCSACGDCHADVNAACVISLGGAACKPARISNTR